MNSQTVPVILQPSNTNPYPQANNVKTPTINPLALQETLNQLVFGITKANPSIQGLINQNSQIVGQNAVEIPKTVSNNNLPRVINNYFIVPPEFFNKNDTLAKKNCQNNVKLKRKRVNNPEVDAYKVPIEREGLKKRKNGLKRQKLQNLKNAEVILEDAVGNNVKPKRRKKSKSRKTKERLIAAPDTEIIIIDDVGVVSDESVRKKKKGKSKRRKSKPEVAQTKSIEVTEEPILEDKSAGDCFEAVSVIQVDKPKRKKKRRNKTKVNEQLDIDDNCLKNIEEPVDNLADCEGEIELSENRKTRNSKSANQRRENTRKVNPIPDDILKAYFPYMNFYNPGNIPYNFEQYYQNNNPLRNLRNKKRRKNVKIVKPPNDTIEITIKTKKEPKDIELNEFECKETVKQDEKFENIELSDVGQPKKDENPKGIESFETVTDTPIELPQNIKPKNDEVITKENYEVFNENIEDLQNYMVPKIDIQPPVPVMYNNVINDYFPVFHDESVYFNENDQAATTRNEERRYFYNTSPEEARKYRRPENGHTKTKYIEKDAEIFVPNQDRDNLRNKFKESTIDLKFDAKILDKYRENPKIEEAIFKPPPFLENPDFTTKNVREYADYKNSNNLENKDKLSVYSDVKIETLPDIKRVRIASKNTRPKVEEIETVFANSKVKKYGVQSESSKSEESTSFSTENNGFQGNETTYIVAKSLGQVDEFYY